MSNSFNSDLNSIIEKYRIKINNSINDSIIKQALLDFGTTKEYLQTGKGLLDQTLEWISI
ncbi:MAG: hypothetical protein JEZ03_05610 [Bacteroidales bacterium]|nr:hypothetical protein [Bacteroidales bacterium]